jgi:hypothetical protein
MNLNGWKIMTCRGTVVADLIAIAAEDAEQNNINLLSVCVQLLLHQNVGAVTPCTRGRVLDSITAQPEEE